MAQSTVVSGIFRFEISKISDLTTRRCEDSIIIRNVPWKLKLCKNKGRKGESLAVYLLCANNDKSTNWSHAATASFKLRSFVEGVNAIEYQVEPYILDNSGTGFGTHRLINWKDLFDSQNGYVKNDTIQLDIEIEVADPNDANKSALICKNVDNAKNGLTKFRLTVTNLAKLMVVQTKELALPKMGWFLTVYKSRSGNLGIRLENKCSAKKCSYNIKMTSKLVSSNANAKKIEQMSIANVKRFGNLDVGDLITWAELLNPKNGYVDKGSIVIEVTLKMIDREDLGMKAGSHKAVKDKDKRKRQKIECAICFEEIANKELSNIPCGHTFCTACITEAIKVRSVCPMCGAPAKLEDLRRTYLNMLN